MLNKVAEQKAYTIRSVLIVTHQVFTLATFLAVNFFYVYGGRPEILRLPNVIQLIFNALVPFVSTLWLIRTWVRNDIQYKKESIANKLRRPLEKFKIDFTSVLSGCTINDLKADELDLLAQVVPQVTQQERIQVYKGVLEESLQSSSMKATKSLKSLELVRQKLEISQEEYYAMLTELRIDDPSLLKFPQEYAQEDRLRIESYRRAIAGLMASEPQSITSTGNSSPAKSSRNN